MRRSAANGSRLHVAEAGAGTRYRFRIDGEIEIPDPASHFQPDDVHGPSEVIDHALSIGRRTTGAAGRGSEACFSKRMSARSRAKARSAR